jgi:hypothetical protein
MRSQVEIRVKGKIDARWSEWLGGLAVTHCDEDETMLTGWIPDQSALYGLMSKLRDLGLQLSAVKVLEDAGAGNDQGSCQNGPDACHEPLGSACWHKQRR